MNGFTFFRNYYEAITDPDNELSEEEQGRLYNAIFSYVFEGKEPELKGACRLAFNLIRPSLDTSKVRGEAGKTTKQKTNENQTEANENQNKSNENQTEANENQNKSNENQNSEVIDFDSDLTFLEKKEREEEREVRKRSKGKEEGCEKIARAREGTPLERFLERWQVNSNAIGNYSGGKLAGIDWDKVSEQVEKSAFLQQQKGIAFFIAHYEEILDGTYADFHPPRRGRGLTEDALEAKRREYDELMGRRTHGST